MCVEEREAPLDDDDDRESSSSDRVQCRSGGGARAAFSSLEGRTAESIFDYLACLRELNRKLSRWDYLPCLARVVKLLPEGDANRAALNTRLDDLSALHDAVADAMECESLEQLDDAALLTSRLPGWSVEMLALQERRRALVFAAMKVAKALRCYDEDLILTALRSAERFDSFAADVVTLTDRLNHVQKMTSVATQQVASEADTDAWVAKLDELVAQLGGRARGDELSFFREVCELAQHVEALSVRAEAARRIEKQPAVRAAAEQALMTVLRPIADTARAPWPREALVFVKRCADPSRLSSEWLRQHFAPLRDACSEIEGAAATCDLAVLGSAIAAAKRYNGLRKSTAGLEARRNALKLSARCAQQELVSAAAAEAAIVAVEGSHRSLVGGPAMEDAMATLHEKAGRPPPKLRRTPGPEAEPEAEPEPEAGQHAESIAVDADLLAAATAGDLDSLIRLLAAPQPPPPPAPEPEAEPEPVDRREQENTGNGIVAPDIATAEPAPEPEPQPEPRSPTPPVVISPTGSLYVSQSSTRATSPVRKLDPAFGAASPPLAQPAAAIAAASQHGVPAAAAIGSLPLSLEKEETETDTRSQSGQQVAAEESPSPPANQDSVRVRETRLDRDRDSGVVKSQGSPLCCVARPGSKSRETRSCASHPPELQPEPEAVLAAADTDSETGQSAATRTAERRVDPAIALSPEAAAEENTHLAERATDTSETETPSLVELLAAAAASGDVAELTRLLATSPPEPTAFSLRTGNGASTSTARIDQPEEAEPPEHTGQAAARAAVSQSVIDTADHEDAEAAVAGTKAARLPTPQPVVDAAINLLISSGALSMQPSSAAALLGLAPAGVSGEPDTAPTQLRGAATDRQREAASTPDGNASQQPTTAGAYPSMVDAIRQCKVAADGSSESEMETAIRAAQLALTRASATPTQEAELRECSAQVTARLSLLRSAIGLLEQAERDASRPELLGQAAAACQEWAHLMPRLKTLSRRVGRAEEKRERREARIQRTHSRQCVTPHPDPL